jgi:hypothetical protein
LFFKKYKGEATISSTHKTMGATMKKGKQVFNKVSSQNSCKHYGDLEEYA